MIALAAVFVVGVLFAWHRADRALRWTLDEIEADEFLERIAAVKPGMLLHPPTIVQLPLPQVSTSERAR